jgi:hypothetical protein
MLWVAMRVYASEVASVDERRLIMRWAHGQAVAHAVFIVAVLLLPP